MVFLELFILIVGVYLSPALAIRPTLLSKPDHALAIPFVSILAITLLVWGLKTLDVYTPFYVQVITATFFVVASLRLLYLFPQRKEVFAVWSRRHVLLLTVASAVSLYVGSKLIIHGFDRDDEIYSWNMWAIQHYQNVAIDFYYTASPYPQMFPKLLSYCYMVLGTIEAQAAAKTSLVVFPIVMFSAIGFAADFSKSRTIYLYIVFSLFILLGLRLIRVFDDGMPDTMMSVAVVMAIFYFLRYREGDSSGLALWLSSACGVVAVLTKQPALVWGLFALPALMVVEIAKKRITVPSALIGVLPIVSALAWILLEGSGFHNNQGVINRSFGDRGIFEQLLHSVNSVLVDDPARLLLVIGSASIVFFTKRGRSIFLLFVIPSLLSWVFLASYDIRAGLPSLLAMSLLLAYTNYGFKRDTPDVNDQPRLTWKAPVVIATLCLLTLCVAASLVAIKSEGKSHPNFKLAKTDFNNFIRPFGNESTNVHALLSENVDSKLWTPTNYVYGLFYGHLDVVRPEYFPGYNVSDVLEELKRERPDIVSDGGDVSFGPAGDMLKQLVSRDCPELFERVAGPENSHRISIFRMNLELLDSCSTKNEK